MNGTKHMRLVAERDNHYELHDTRDKKHFKVPKKGLSKKLHDRIRSIQRFAEGGEVEGRSDGSNVGADAGSAPVTVNVNAAPAQPSVGAMVNDAVNGRVNPAPIAAEPPAAPVAPVAPVTPPPRMPSSSAPSMVSQGQAAQALSEKGVREQSQSEAQASAANAQALQENNARMQKLMAGYNDSRAALDKEHEDLKQAVMTQNIDPDRYWHNKSLPGKVSTAIGVILGGIGAGLQHSTTNQALNVLQDAIKNDIEAQKADLGKKQSLLSMNLERYKNLDAATAATMAQMNSLVAGQLQLNAAKSGSLRAQGNADVAIGQLRNKYLLEAPNLALQDFKVKELHELEGTTPNAGGAGHILGTAPGGGPVTQGVPGSTAAGTPNGGAPYGTGVNTNKLSALKITGLIDKEAGNKATEEYGKYVKLQHELQEADSVFNIAARNATLAGRISRAISPHEIEGGGTSFVGDIVRPIAVGAKHLITLGEEQTKKYRAVVEPFVDKLAKDVTGRSTPISIEKLGNVMPEHGDSPETIAIKRAKLHDILKSSYSFPTLVEHGLVHKRDPLLVLDSEEK